jgi:hypothetical protein
MRIPNLREDIERELVKYKETEGMSGITLSDEQIEQLRQWYRRNHQMSFDKNCDDCIRNTINRIINLYAKNG